MVAVPAVTNANALLTLTPCPLVDVPVMDRLLAVNTELAVT